VANILGFEITKANGKTNWPEIRKTAYVFFLTWIIGVRFLNLYPFDDFFRPAGVGFDTLFDSLSLYAIWLINWHIVWGWRPRVA
jgi:hypothetical protein